jgi:hypothetical protein
MVLLNHPVILKYWICYYQNSECTEYEKSDFAKKRTEQFSTPLQGCQMVCFQTKNPNLRKNSRASDWKILIYFMAVWNILRIFGIFCDHSVHFVFIWYILSGFVIMHHEKSGNSAPMQHIKVC